MAWLRCPTCMNDFAFPGHVEPGLEPYCAKCGSKTILATEHSPLPWAIDSKTWHVVDADGIPVLFAVPKKGNEPRQILTPERRAANILLIVKSVNGTIGKPDHLVKEDE